MRTALVFFRSPENRFDSKYYADTVSVFADGGMNIDTVEVLSDTDDIGFKRRFNEFTDVMDSVVIIGGEKACFPLKEIIAESLGTVLVENENAKTFLDAVSKKQGKNLDVIIKWFYICNDFRNEVRTNTKTEVK